MLKKCNNSEFLDAATMKEKFLILDWSQLWMRNKVEKKGNKMKKFIWSVKKWMNEMEARKINI